MYKRISAVKARQNLGQVMNEVALRGDEYVVERAGKALVAIIPMEKYQSMRQELDEFIESLKSMSANITEQDSNLVEKLADEGVRSYRRSKAKKQ